MKIIFFLRVRTARAETLRRGLFSTDFINFAFILRAFSLSNLKKSPRPSAYSAVFLPLLRGFFMPRQGEKSSICRLPHRKDACKFTTFPRRGKVSGALVRLTDEGKKPILPMAETIHLHFSPFLFRPSSITFGDSFPPRGSLFVYFVTFYDGPRGNFFRMLFAFRASKGSLFFCLSAKPLLPHGRRGIFWIQKCPDAIMRRGKKRSGFIR